MRRMRGPVSTRIRFLVILGTLVAVATAPLLSWLVTPRVLAAPDADASLRREWYRAIFGVGIGATGLHAADIDNDGVVEIVAGAGPIGFDPNNYWYVVSRHGSGYAHEWVSLPYPSPITGLRVAQLDADAALEVLVATGNTILVYDGATRQLEHNVTAPVTGISGLNAADVDGDGALELVFCNASDLFVLELATGVVEFEGTGLGGTDVAVGEVDGDPSLEIVVGNGDSSGNVIDGQTHVLEWSNPAGFGNFVRLADVDGDGLAEIVAGFAWYDGVTVYDADTRTTKYSVPVFNMGALRVADLEGDGALEVVYGDLQGGPVHGVHVLDGATGAQKWAIASPTHHVTDIAVGDVDGDGVAELIWGAGYHSTDADHLYVADAVTRILEWENLDVSGPFYGLAHRDVDADGVPELLYTSYQSDSVYQDGYLFVHDAVTKELEFQHRPAAGWEVPGVWRVQSANVDGDPQAEILVSTSWGYRGTIICYDGLSHAEQWRATAQNSAPFRSMRLADVDGDGALEVVAAAGFDGVGPEILVYVFDAATGAVEWQVPRLRTGLRSLSLLRLANVDADPQPEIVVAEWHGEVFVLDAVTRSVGLTTADLGVTALDTPDRDGDGVAEILIGTETGALRVLDPATGAVVETIGSYGSQINGLGVTDVGGDGVADYVFAAGDRLRVVNGITGVLEWSSELLGSKVGAHDSLLVDDIDGDAVKEVMVNVGHGLMVFEARLHDVTPPTTAITSPADGASATGIVPILVSASDDVAVTRVELYVDGVLQGTDEVAPYSFSWDSRGVPAGEHAIFAEAHDGANNVGASATISVTVVDTTAPTIALTAPAPGSIVSGAVLVTASASDNTGVTLVEFRVDTILRGSDSVPPYSFSWGTTAFSNGRHDLTVQAFDAAGNSESSTISVTVSNPAPVITAIYDPVLRAPWCATVGRACDSGALLNGRASLGPEPHAPNTIGTSCADGTSGTYHFDESNDRIRVSTLDGTALAVGKTVRVDATVWAWSGYSTDRLDLYRASNPASPVWTHIATLTPTAAGPQVLSATFVLPAGTVHAVRARFRWQGSAAACGAGPFNDHDDLVFAVRP